MSKSNLPLAGVKVLEFTHAVMGPSAGMIMADLGAEVIHIEPPQGDPTRRLKGFGIGYFAYFNRNKKSLAVNLKDPRGKVIINKLIAETDVVLENFAPGTMTRLGLGYQELAAVNPGLVYCSLKGFLKGPYQERHAMDEVVQMMAGLAYMTGPPGQPLRAGSSVVDITGGMFGVIAIQAALLERARTGKGTFVKSSLFETCAFLMGQHMACSAISRQPVPPMPARVSAWSVYRTFKTADGEDVFIGIISEKHWVRFCEAFEQKQWLQDGRLATNNRRIAEREWLLPQIETLIAGLKKADVIARLQDNKIPFAPIATPEDLFEDPQLNGDNGLLPTTFPDGTVTKMPRLPLEMADADLGLRNDPPVVGLDTEPILRTRLGYSEQQIAALAAANVIRIAAAGSGADA